MQANNIIFLLIQACLCKFQPFTQLLSNTDECRCPEEAAPDECCLQRKSLAVAAHILFGSVPLEQRMGAAGWWWVVSLLLRRGSRMTRSCSRFMTVFAGNSTFWVL